MEDIIYNLVADLKQDGGVNYVIVKVPQGGVGNRHIHVIVTENGVRKTLPTGTQATYTCKGHNGAGASIEFNCSVSNNEIIIPIRESMVVSNGVGKYRVEINDTSTTTPTLSTFTFNISVEKDPLPPEEIMASDDYQTLKSLIDRVEGATSNWLIGHGTPASSLGRDLDLYLDIDTGKVYKKTSGSWIYQGSLGNQIYFAYATSGTGADFSTTYDGTQSYLGICTSQDSTQPLTPSSYTWIMISGGDNMKKSDYHGTDNGTVARADSIKGEFVISGISIPANTTTATTTVTVTHEAIGASSILEGVYTSNGINTIDRTLSNGVLTLVFPACPDSATAMVKIWNMGDYIYPLPYEWDDFNPPVAEDTDIDWSEFSV